MEHIIAAVNYSADQCESICINYISTGVGYYIYGYGTLILHMAQVFASEYNLNHQKQSTSTDNTVTQKTYLMCTKKTYGYYVTLSSILPTRIWRHWCRQHRSVGMYSIFIVQEEDILKENQRF